MGKFNIISFYLFAIFFQVVVLASLASEDGSAFKITKKKIRQFGEVHALKEDVVGYAWGVEAHGPKEEKLSHSKRVYFRGTKSGGVRVLGGVYFSKNPYESLRIAQANLPKGESLALRKIVIKKGTPYINLQDPDSLKEWKKFARKESIDIEDLKEMPSGILISYKMNKSFWFVAKNLEEVLVESKITSEDIDEGEKDLFEANCGPLEGLSHGDFRFFGENLAFLLNEVFDRSANIDDSFKVVGENCVRGGRNVALFGCSDNFSVVCRKFGDGGYRPEAVRGQTHFPLSKEKMSEDECRKIRDSRRGPFLCIRVGEKYQIKNILTNGALDKDFQNLSVCLEEQRRGGENFEISPDYTKYCVKKGEGFVQKGSMQRNSIMRRLGRWFSRKLFGEKFFRKLEDCKNEFSKVAHVTLEKEIDEFFLENEWEKERFLSLVDYYIRLIKRDRAKTTFQEWIQRYMPDLEEKNTFKNILVLVEEKFQAVKDSSSKEILEKVKPYYQRPYRDAPRHKVTRNGQTVQRANHSLAHGMRQGYLAKDIILLLSKSTSEDNPLVAWIRSKLEEDEHFLRKIELASAFQRSGREGEISGDNKLYKSYVLASAKNFTNTILNDKSLESLFSGNDEIYSYTRAILSTNKIKGIGLLEKSKDAYFLNQIIHSAHMLDLRRIPGFNKERIKKVVCDLIGNSSDTKRLVDALWHRAGLYLHATGDKDMDAAFDKGNWYSDRFFEVHKRPQKMLENLEAVFQQSYSVLR